MFNILDVMTDELTDLGLDENILFKGVLAPASVKNRSSAGVTAQFLEDAEHYHQKYYDISYANYLLETAINALELKNEINLILDIGSGSGPTVFSLMNKFPSAHIVATDVSPQLLAILRSALEASKKGERCTTLCLDLNRPWFHKVTFDLCLGSAILHHLFEPDLMLKQIFPTLRSGGAMIFFEPFETGYATLSLVYQIILAKENVERLLPEVISDFFRGKIAQIEEMKCEPKDPVLYADVDDKWLFTNSYFEKIGAVIGARKTLIVPLNVSDQPFTDQITTALRLGLALPPGALPQWAWDVVAGLEKNMSSNCKNDFALERCVIFVK